MKNSNVLRYSLVRNAHFYYIMVIVLGIFETAMLVWGAIRYDLSNPVYISLMVVYFVLLGSSVWIFFIVRRNQNKRKYSEVTQNSPVAITAYGVIVLICAAYTALVDAYLGLTTTVFLCAILGVSGVVEISPKIYVPLVSVLFLIINIIINAFFIEGDNTYWVETVHQALIVIISIIVNIKNNRHNELEYSHYEFSFKDGLTGAYNRRALDEDIETYSQSESIFYVGLIDCDNFKQVNDNFGHRFGDEILVSVVEKLVRSFGQEGVYRYGGDEFAVVTRASAGKIKSMINRINKEFAEIYGDKNISISAGFSLIEDNYCDIFKSADEALYVAKEKKGKCVISQKDDE